MKVFKYIVWSVLIFLGVFYVLPAGLLQVPYFQKKISSEIAEYLESKLQTPVQIERVEFELFNKIILKDVYFEDRSEEIAFRAKRLAANFDFLPLFKGKFRIHSVQLFTFDFNLYKETEDSPLNIQYIIDAFSNPDPEKEDKNIDLRIEKINLRLGNFSYRVNDAPATPGIFNSKDIGIKDISAKIHLQNLTNEEADLKLRRLSLKEQSGFEIRNLAFDIKTNKGIAIVDELSLQLDKSRLILKDIFVDYLEFEKGKPEKITIDFTIHPSDIYLKELKAFVPTFAWFEDRINIQGVLSGNPNDFSFREANIRDNGRFSIQTELNIRNLLQKSENLYFNGEIKESSFSPEGIQKIINNFVKETLSLPPEIGNLGTVRFTGELKGYENDLQAIGHFNTQVGSLEANVNFGESDVQFIRGHIASTGLDLQNLLQNSNFGDIVFAIDLDAKQSKQGKPEGLIDASIEKLTYKNYTYENMALDGEFSDSHFRGLLNINDPNGKIKAEGLFAFNDVNSEFQFDATINDIKLNKLNLTNRYKNASLSLDVDAHFTGNNPDNMLGDIAIHNLDFSTEDGQIVLNPLLFSAKEMDEGKLIKVQTPVLNGEVRGVFSFKSLFRSLKETLAYYLPSIIEAQQTSPILSENNLTLDFTLEETNEISQILKIPFTNLSQAKIQGSFNNFDNRLHLEADIPKAHISGAGIESTLIELTTSPENTSLDIHGLKLRKKSSPLKFSANLTAADNSIETLLNWGNGESKYKGNLSFNTAFSRQEKKSPLRTKIGINRSEMAFNDSVWVLYPSQIQIDTPENIRINNFLAAHEGQFLKIQGAISTIPEDELFIQLNEVDLEYIFESLAKKSLDFGGIATGYVIAKDLFKSRQLSTELDVKDFSFNDVVFGDLDLKGIWDDGSQGILMDGWVYKNDSTTVDVDGVIYPVKEEISIDFDARNTDARFLRKYVNGFVQELTGELTGKLRLFGNLNDPTVEGKVFAENCRFFIEYLNAYYTFSDFVSCYPDEIFIRNVPIYDSSGNSAITSGYVKHHLFSDFQFQANMSFENFLVFNATKESNPVFYGTAFGTGNASLSGTEYQVNIDVSLQNTQNTHITLNFMEEEDIIDYDFINFISHADSTKSEKSEQTKKNQMVQKEDSESTDIRLNLMLDVTPYANFDLIMDPVAGDKISGFGSGNMQIQYGTKTPLRIYGNYRINEGKYNFSLQQAWFRNFDIRQGSLIRFQGDPYTAELDINAAYRVTANLSDLDQELVRQNYSARNSVAVDCILHIAGIMTRPSISFDLDLPGATAELARQVKSYIRTEDMMNRQFVFLLVLSRFYTSPEYIANSSGGNDLSYLTSTLSTQLSSILGNISDKVQLGTKFHQSYEGDQANTEFEVLLSSQLFNNRLIINGNFGYIDNPYIQNANRNVPLVGDFDIEYKLTPSGDIRLKGFNHYNYRNYFSQTPEMTQGLGILFRKDFNHFLELFGKK